MNYAFDAYVGDIVFARGGAVFALGDGTVRFEGGERVQAHDGAVLTAAPHPSGEGVITGGDDGRVVWSRPGGAQVLAPGDGRWVDALAASPVSGLIAYAAARQVRVLDVSDPGFGRVFAHEHSVAALAFDPKGKRLAAATYGGAALWFARIAEQKPQMLKWAGSHIVLAFSPDGRFLVSAMQENALHGWRLSDQKDMKMGGYPNKVRSLAFMAKGALLATAGAPGAVVWPFAGASGPMGKEAAEVGFDESAAVTRVAAEPSGFRLAAGLDDGRVWTADLQGRGLDPVKADKGAPVSALAVSPDGARVAWGAEDGGAGVSAIG